MWLTNPLDNAVSTCLHSSEQTPSEVGLNEDTLHLRTTHSTPHRDENRTLRGWQYPSYASALENRASKDGFIVLVFVDYAAIRMGLNFYQTSLRSNGIETFLFVSSGAKLCEEFWARHIPCHVYAGNMQSDKLSRYGSKAFKQKMNIRTFMILEALHLGYSVLHSDADVYFFKDPLSNLHVMCDEHCDIAALVDNFILNAGFVYIRNTQASIRVYKHMKNIAENTAKDDQVALNIAIGRQMAIKNITLVRLPKKKYKCGKNFYQEGRRNFAGDNPCPECLVVHNNWIIGQEAKEYRFKELHQWMFDEDHYFTDHQRKYITYENPYYFTNDVRTWELEKEALQNALAIGQITNRTVILPRFHCGKTRTCSLVHKINIRPFDGYFGDKYRMSTYLEHPLVSKKLRSSQSPVMLITNKHANAETVENIHVQFTPSDSTDGATSDEIAKWFITKQVKILKFAMLYGSFSHFTDKPTGLRFKEKCVKGFIKTTYHSI